MFLSFLSKWIEGRRRKDRVGKVGRTPRASLRLRLEALEDRTLMNAGALDAAFGSAGVAAPSANVSTPLSFSFQSDFVVQRDGKLVEAAPTNSAGFNVLRQNANGLPDVSFGIGGTVVCVIPPNVLPSDANAFSSVTVSALAAEADGKVLVAGTIAAGVTQDPYPGMPESYHLDRHHQDAFIVRLNSDGTVDQTFAVGGFIANALAPGLDDTATSLVLQADGKIVLAGDVDNQFALARYDAAGNLDASFGNGGTVVTAIGAVDRATSMALQTDGRIIVAGSFQDFSLQTALAMARFNTDGSLDSTFGASGSVETALGSMSTATDVAIQADGDVVAAGWRLAPGSGYAGSEAVLVRYTTAGIPDASFGDDGRVFTGLRADNSYLGANAGAGPKLALQTDGKILLGTNSAVGIVDGLQIAEEIVLARYNAAGAADSSFGNNGQVATTLGQDSTYLSGLAIQANGRFVIEGISYDFGHNHFNLDYTPHLTLAGFQNDPAPLVYASVQSPTAAPTMKASQSIPSPMDDPSASSVTPTISRPTAVLTSSLPSQVVPNNLVFTQAATFPTPSTATPQTSVVLVETLPVTASVVASNPSVPDPFGIHLVGGSGPGNLDATTTWDGFRLFSPDYPLGSEVSELVASAFTPDAVDAATNVMDAVFQQMPSPTWAEPSAALLADISVIENPIPSPFMKSESRAGRWPSLAAGVLLSTGMTVAVADKHRRRRRLAL